MRVCVLGTGYVGLVSGACLAEIGHDVVCVDLDDGKVQSINRGDSPIFEKGLDEILVRTVGHCLSATTSLADGMRDADVVLICVGTPFDGSQVDLSFVARAAADVGAQLAKASKYCVVVVKSTVIPGTTDGLVRQTLESASGKVAGKDFGLGMNPEFLAEGVAVEDFLHPDRIVLGGFDDRSLDVLEALYEQFEGVPVVRTNIRTAETIKYASNALLATLISYSNEVAHYCEQVGEVDVVDVMKGVHLMKHLGWQEDGGARRLASATSFLWSGCGFGGSCFPKDVRALIADANGRGGAFRILDAVIETNDNQPLHMIELLSRGIGSLTGKRVAVLGLAFKPGTDDVRESPALPIVLGLIENGAKVVCHDPIAIDNARLALSARGVADDGVRFEEDLQQALSNVDAILVVTSWPEYRELSSLLPALGDVLIVDGRRMLSKTDFSRYTGIGMG